MQGEVRGLPLFYSYVGLMGEGKCAGISERGETTKGRKGKRWKERVAFKKNKKKPQHCRNMVSGEPMLSHIVLETNESPMLRGRGEVKSEEVVRENGKMRGEKRGETVVIVPSAFQSCF